MHTETEAEVRAQELFKERVEGSFNNPFYANQSVSRVSPSNAWKGTYDEKHAAYTSIRARDAKMEKQYGMAFSRMKAKVVEECKALFRQRRYQSWDTTHASVWTKVCCEPTWPAGKDFILVGPDNAKALRGLRASYMILDDPHASTTKGKKVKQTKPKPKTYNTVGVRFLRGHNLAKVYTYKVPKKTKLQLGEEVVVPSTMEGFTTNGIAVVVELHKEQQDTTFGIEYKFVAGRIARIAL